MAGQPVSFFLSHLSDRYWSTYYYVQVGQIIFLSMSSADRERSVSSDSVLLPEHFPCETSEIEPKLLLRFESDSVLTGIWTRGDRSVPVDLKASKVAGSYEFEPYAVQDSDAVPLRIKIVPEIETSVSIVLPIADSESSTFLCSKMSKYIGGSANSPNGLRTCVQSRMKRYFENTAHTLKKLIAGKSNRKIMSDDPSGWYNFHRDESIDLRYEGDGFVVFYHDSFEYTDGAYSDDDLTIHVLDVKEHRELALSDVIAIEPVALEHLLYVIVHKRGLTNETEEEFSQEFGPSIHNFYITPKGIGFHWSSPSVASYSDGPIEYFIPFSHLKEKLTPWFKQRMGL